MKALWTKLLILAGVTVLLLFVLMRIGWLVDERQGRQREAESGVAAAQAGEQVLLGPLLQRTCTEVWEEPVGSGVDRRLERQRRDTTLTAVPATLTVDGMLRQEARQRGLFKVNGYAGQVTLSAQWPATVEQLTQAPQNKGIVTCESPRVMVAVSDARGLRAVQLTHGAEALTVRPGTRSAVWSRGLHADLAPEALAGPLRLTVALDLIGMNEFSLVPAAAATQVTLRSDWPHPSFGGRFLPATREVNDSGFNATWQVTELASTAAQDVLNQVKLGAARGATTARYGEPTAPQPEGSAHATLETLGFSMIDPVNPYVMSDRAIKYGLMFIVLTFVCVGLLELLSGRRVHPVQYLLVGLAMALFFLLLLSLSEHLGFTLSYALAAGAVVLMLSAYGVAMIGRLPLGGAFGALIATLYGLLFVLLRQEQSALLVGALLLFAVLALVMFLTRRIDWYGLQTPPAPRTPHSAGPPGSTPLSGTRPSASMGG